MSKWKGLFWNLMICLMIFCFCENVYALKTHNTDTGWSFGDIRNRIETNQTTNTPDTSGFGAHIWHNAKCIEFYEKWTGKNLKVKQKEYILLGGVSADYAIAGSSDDNSLYNTIGWFTPLGDNWNGEYKGVQETKCLHHFFNGLQFDNSSNRNKSQERLTDLYFNGKWFHVSALEWAYDHPDNNYDISDVFANRGTPGSWRAMGEVLHLILDMIVPDHTRNDNHCGAFNYGLSYYEEELGKVIYDQLGATSKFSKFSYPAAMKMPGADLTKVFVDLQAKSAGNYFSSDTMFKTEQAGISLPKVAIGNWAYKDGVNYYILNFTGQKIAKYSDDYTYKYSYNFPGTYEQARKLTEQGYITIAGFEDWWADMSKEAIAYGVGFVYMCEQVMNNDIGYFANGWDREKSMAFVKCFYDNGGEKEFGLTWDNGKGKYVYQYPNSGDNALWVQNYLKDSQQTIFVYNPRLKQAFPVCGKILKNWLENTGYKLFGAPFNKAYTYSTCNERDGRDYKIWIRQDFEYEKVVKQGENWRQVEIVKEWIMEDDKGNVKDSIIRFQTAAANQTSPKITPKNIYYQYSYNPAMDITLQNRT